MRGWVFEDSLDVVLEGLKVTRLCGTDQHDFGMCGHACARCRSARGGAIAFS